MPFSCVLAHASNLKLGTSLQLLVVRLCGSGEHAVVETWICRGTCAVVWTGDLADSGGRRAMVPGGRFFSPLVRGELLSTCPSTGLETSMMDLLKQCLDMTMLI